MQSCPLRISFSSATALLFLSLSLSATLSRDPVAAGGFLRTKFRAADDRREERGRINRLGRRRASCRYDKEKRDVAL